ncbi:uncharacterized protein [Euphorbia lathyris]|uniref:uncharacterized protein n=1 Tax=Euphorbia lathyris TaxID=212925 RepID=UPI003313FAF2
MYPRLKVKIQEEEDDDYEFSPPHQVFQSLSHIEKEKEKEKPLIAKIIITTTTLNSTREKVSASKVNNSTNTLWRPRAILSSPANDRVIGKRNKMNNDRFSVVRKCNSEPKILKKSLSETPPALRTGKGINVKKCKHKLHMQ